MSSLATRTGPLAGSPRRSTLHEETLRRRQAKLGPDHLDTLESMGSLAVAYHDAGRLTAALPLYEEITEAIQTKLGLDHPDTLTS